MTKILITGGAGYVGSHSVKRFLEEGHKVVVVDNLTTGYKQAIETLSQFGNLTFFQQDLLDKEGLSKIFETNDIDTVIHFAASTRVNESMENPAKYFRNNIVGTLNLLESMIDNSVKNIIFSSTCATYGDTQYVPVDEKHIQNPANPYGESKLAIEKMIQWFGTLQDLNYVILRYFNVCGCDETGTIGDGKNPSTALMQNAVRGAMDIEEFKLVCPKVDTPDGTTIRDYIDVTDLTDAHYKAFEYLSDGRPSEIFNLGTGKGSSVLEIVNVVENIFGTEIGKNRGETRQGEYAKIYATYEKAKQALGWEPTKTLEESVRNLKKWYTAHPNGWEY
jgi:UDP-glucose 4-epimerase